MSFVAIRGQVSFVTIRGQVSFVTIRGTNKTVSFAATRGQNRCHLWVKEAWTSVICRCKRPEQVSFVAIGGQVSIVAVQEWKRCQPGVMST